MRPETTYKAANVDREASEIRPAHRVVQRASRQIRVMASRSVAVLCRQARADPDRPWIRAELAQLESFMHHGESAHTGDNASVHIAHRQDATNLVH